MTSATAPATEASCAGAMSQPPLVMCAPRMQVWDTAGGRWGEVPPGTCMPAVYTWWCARALICATACKPCATGLTIHQSSMPCISKQSQPEHSTIWTGIDSASTSKTCWPAACGDVGHKVLEWQHGQPLCMHCAGVGHGSLVMRQACAPRGRAGKSKVKRGQAG